eukprot:6474525-Amphidinium_carterae.2
MEAWGPSQKFAMSEVLLPWIVGGATCEGSPCTKAGNRNQNNGAARSCHSNLKDDAEVSIEGGPPGQDTMCSLPS